MELIRIENTKGEGPFSDLDDLCVSGISLYGRAVHFQGHNPGTLPAPGAEPRSTPLGKWARRTGRVHMPRCWVTGCTDADQLLKWFPSAKGREAMATAGLIPWVYEVPDDKVKMGSVQAMFRRPNAVRRGWLDPVTLQPGEGDPPPVTFKPTKDDMLRAGLWALFTLPF